MIAIAVLVLGLCQPTLATARASLCSNYRALVGQVSETGQTLRIKLWKDEELALDSAIACAPGGEGTPSGDFCSAALAATGPEFYHNYPYQLLSCLGGPAAGLRVTRTEQYTGLVRRERIVHLTAGAGDRVFIDLAFKPEPEQASGQWSEYFGVYELVIWKAD
ncbi:MAG: hypothetical protein Q7U20_09955 [Caulobacter sp.]|nr:hypothetical protein [Caulobacter sp.]